MNKEKYQFIQDNINYILGPYYIVNQKSGVVSINYQKLRKMPDSLLKILVDYLTGDSDEIKNYLDKVKDNPKMIDSVYLGLSEIEGLWSNRDKCYILLLNSIKKYLNKINNQEGLKILSEYYKKNN